MENSIFADLEKGYLIFLIDGEEYGIDLKTLYSIIKPLEDFTPRYLINMGKNSLQIDDEEFPFISLYDLLNKKSPAHSKDTRIIIADVKDHKVAFYVEKINEFISTDAKGLLPLKFTKATDESFIKCKIKFNERYILLPNFDRILAQTIS